MAGQDIDDTITFGLPKALKASAVAKAKNEGSNISVVLRQKLMAYLKEGKKVA